MSGAEQAGLGLGVGVVVLGVVGALLSRALTPTREIERYAGEIAATIDAIARNTEGGAEILHTRELATAVPALAGRLLGGSS